MLKTKEIFKCHSTCCTAKVLQQGRRYICFKCRKECNTEQSNHYGHDSLSGKYREFKNNNNI